jgi:uncharacterized protein YrrD
MLVPYTKIVGSPIVEIRTQLKVGVVGDLAMQKSDLSLSGIILRNNFLDFSKRVISASDIVDISNQAVIINDEDSIVPLPEAVRIKEALEKNLHGILQRVVTKKGKNIGIVTDYLVESTTLSITKFYCKTLLTEKIIPKNSVTDIVGKKIIIKDDFETVRVGSPVIESSLV